MAAVHGARHVLFVACILYLPDFAVQVLFYMVSSVLVLYEDSYLSSEKGVSELPSCCRHVAMRVFPLYSALLRKCGVFGVR